MIVSKGATYNNENLKYFVSIEDWHSRQLLQLSRVSPALDEKDLFVMIRLQVGGTEYLKLLLT